MKLQIWFKLIDGRGCVVLEFTVELRCECTSVLCAFALSWPYKITKISQMVSLSCKSVVNWEFGTFRKWNSVIIMTSVILNWMTRSDYGRKRNSIHAYHFRKKNTKIRCMVLHFFNARSFERNQFCFLFFSSRLIRSMKRCESVAIQLTPQRSDC